MARSPRVAHNANKRVSCKENHTRAAENKFEAKIVLETGQRDEGPTAFALPGARLRDRDRIRTTSAEFLSSNPSTKSGQLHPSFIKIGSTVPLLLTPRGYDVLHGQGRAEWAHPFPDIDASRFSHEILVQKLRLALEKFGAEQWLSERRLAQINRKDGLPYVPDARFHAPGGKFALEVERTLKAKKRLHEFLKVRAKSNQSTKLLYVLPERLLKPFGKAIGDSFARFDQDSTC